MLGVYNLNEGLPGPVFIYEDETLAWRGNESSRKSNVQMNNLKLGFVGYTGNR